MLDAETTKARIAAGRLLRGLSQAELGELLEQDGLGKHDPGRIERGQMALQAKHRVAFAKHLRLPEEWFTEPDFDKILNATNDDTSLMEDLLGEIRAHRSHVADELGRRYEADGRLIAAVEENRRILRDLLNGVDAAGLPGQLRQLQRQVDEMQSVLAELVVREAEDTAQNERASGSSGPPRSVQHR